MQFYVATVVLPQRISKIYNAHNALKHLTQKISNRFFHIFYSE